MCKRNEKRAQTCSLNTFFVVSILQFTHWCAVQNVDFLCRENRFPSVIEIKSRVQ